MALELMDEHEKGERVRAWLRDNGSAIVFGIALGVAALAGYSWWDSRAVEYKVTAATQYQALADALERKDVDAAVALSAELAKSYPDTPYAAFAALQIADAKIAAGDAEAASGALEQARSLSKEPEIEAIVSLRQARIALNRGEHDRAIEIATGIKSEAFAGLAAEVRGDALVAAGRSDDARAAYQEALTALETGAANRSIVEMKLADLGGLHDAPEA
jgi:predicted negative regulator of RcsB-dependent stress response